MAESSEDGEPADATSSRESEPAARDAGGGAGAGGDDEGAAAADAADPDEEDLAALRRQVEAEYDFDDFGPAEMARMSPEEWEAAFDPDSWIVGEALLDRTERDLKSRIARRDVFAALDRVTEEGEPRLAAWSDEGYALVYPDGAVEGRGTVLRDVKASVALCSMDSYEPDEPPEEFDLPDPDEVPEGTGEFGNLMLQVVAAAQVLSGLVLFGAWLAQAVTTIVAPVAAGAFVLVGLFLFGVVANARLSDRFRAEEFRNRLRAVEAAGGSRPEELPPVIDERAAPDPAAADEPATGREPPADGAGASDDGAATTDGPTRG
jgi:hypothetical protein